MKPIDYVKKAICYVDMFYSTELLRYESNKDYRTVTGGIISLSIILMISLGFASMIIDTLNKTTINSTLNIKKSSDPSFYNLKTDAQNMFMFGVRIQSEDLAITLDLATGPRYFDIKFLNYNIINGKIGGVKQFNFVQCTDEHWKIKPQIIKKKNIYLYQNWLCPQIGQQIPIQGAYTSPNQFLGNIHIAPCSNSSIDSRPCHPKEVIDSVFEQSKNYYLALYYINPVISPTQTQHISYYLQGNDYVLFSQTQGSEAWFYFSEYQIHSDDSIWPYSKNTFEQGVIVQNKAINHPFTRSNFSGYANFFFSRSQDTLIYQRSVQKISAVFSYIGGLVGAISAFLFLLRAYNASSLQLGISLSLFQKTKKHPPSQCYEKNAKIQRKQQHQKNKQTADTKINLNLNFFSWISLMLYKSLRYLNFKFQWTKEQILCDFQNQILHQLDISILIQRLVALQNCISLLFSKPQLQGMKFQRKIDLQKACFLRQMLIKANQKQYLRFYEQTKSLDKKIEQTNSHNNCLGTTKGDQNISPEIAYQQDFQRRTKQKNIHLYPKTYFNPMNPNLQREKMGTFISKQFINYETIESLKFLKVDKDRNLVSLKIWNNLDPSLRQFIEDSIENQVELKKECLGSHELDQGIDSSRQLQIQQVDHI